MEKILNLFLVVVAILRSAHELQASSATSLPAKPEQVVNFEVIRNTPALEENHPGHQLEPLTKVVTYTLGHRKPGASINSEICIYV